MKKYMILATVILMSWNTNAQNMSIGPVAGIGHSWISDNSPQAFKPAGYLGLEFMFSQHEHFGLSTNLLVSHEGFAKETTIKGVNYRTTIDPVYLRMTPKAYYFFGRLGDAVRPKIFLGPSIAVKITEDQHNTADPVFVEGSSVTTRYNTDFFNTVDVGAEGGVGVNVRVGRNTWFNIDGSYYQGLINTTAYNNMNQSVKLNFGLMFGL